MSYFEFKHSDVFTTVLKLNPSFDFFIYKNNIYQNSNKHIDGVHSKELLMKHQKTTSLYELNVDRDESLPENLIRPFIIKDSSTKDFFFSEDLSLYDMGEAVYGEYPIFASINFYRYFSSSESGGWFATYGEERLHYNALRNVINHTKLYTPSIEFYDDERAITIIEIPSVIFGSELQRGEIEISIHFKGELIATAKDNSKGEMIQTYSDNTTNDDSVIGHVLYKDGFIILFADWALTDDITIRERYRYLSRTDGPTAFGIDFPRWVFFGELGIKDLDLPMPPDEYYPVKTNFNLKFKGTTITPTINMIATAVPRELNYSQNPTFIYNNFEDSEYDLQTYHQIQEKELKETNTMISKINIYDEQKELIAVAKLAKPLTLDKTEFNFKLKLDI